MPLSNQLMPLSNLAYGLTPPSWQVSTVLPQVAGPRLGNPKTRYSKGQYLLKIRHARLAPTLPASSLGGPLRPGGSLRDAAPQPGAEQVERDHHDHHHEDVGHHDVELELLDGLGDVEADAAGADDAEGESVAYVRVDAVQEQASELRDHRRRHRPSEVPRPVPDRSLPSPRTRACP